MAVAHMYALAISVDMEHQGYNCIHYSEEILSLQKRGRYLDFYAQFHQQLLDSDKALLSGIFDAKLYSRQTYAEGEMRIWDKNKKLHYYTYYSTRISTIEGEKIMLLLRNIDDKNSRNMNLHYSAPTECAIIISPMRWLKCTMQSIMSTCRNIDFIFCGLPKSSLPIC